MRGVPTVFYIFFRIKKDLWICLFVWILYCIIVLFFRIKNTCIILVLNKRVSILYLYCIIFYY